MEGAVPTCHLDRNAKPRMEFFLKRVFHLSRRGDLSSGGGTPLLVWQRGYATGTGIMYNAVQQEAWPSG